MRVLFDQGVPVPLRRLLPMHDVATAYELGWSTLKNGDLIALAEAAGFVVMVTTDTNLQYQQNLEVRSLAIIVLGSTSWPRIQTSGDAVVACGGFGRVRVLCCRGDSMKPNSTFQRTAAPPLN